MEPNPTEPPAERVVRVFVSSTFRDMHAERDHLVAVVFPELRERLEKLGLELFDVDLRWGVPENGVDGDQANSWEYCKRWIDRSEPLFLGMLGERYGYIPPVQQIRAPEDRIFVEMSVTEMEIRHAVLSRRLQRCSFFYLRDTQVPRSPEIAPEVFGEFVDPEPAAGKLLKLRNEIGAGDAVVRRYTPQWTGRGFRGLEAFGRLVLEDLWSSILRNERYVAREVWRRVLGQDPSVAPAYTDATQPLPSELWSRLVVEARPAAPLPLDEEAKQVTAFIRSRLRWFHGRGAQLDALHAFACQRGEDTTPGLCAVVAAPGQGKSALIAALAQRLAATPHVVIAHFVGATEQSGDVRSLMMRLLGELERHSIQPVLQGQETEDSEDLRARLAARLGDYNEPRHVVLLIDGVNQLTDGQDLAWLPTRLGRGVRIVLSCAAGTSEAERRGKPSALAALRGRAPAPLWLELGPLEEGDVRVIVVEYLEEFSKELDRKHVDAICAIPQAHNPLYLLVMLGELRTLGGNDLNRTIPGLIAELPRLYPDTVALFNWVLERLEVFGKEAVRWWCIYLALGRVGMSSRELADLLQRKLGPEASHAALRIERGLRRYLQRRGPQLDFFHSQLRQAVENRYLTPATSDLPAAHADIAAYLEMRWRGRGVDGVPDRHAIGELPHHQAQALQWDHLEQLLTDPDFLEARNAAGMMYELMEDMTVAVASLPAERPGRNIVALLDEAIRRDVRFIAAHASDYPQALFQCLWNSCWWYDSAEAARRYEKPASGWGGVPPWARSGPKLCDLLERWRHEKERRKPGFIWLRSLVPPHLHLGTPQRAVFLENAAHVLGVAFTPDGRRVVSASRMGSLHVWDIRSGRELFMLCPNEGFCGGLALSPDGTSIATGMYEKTVILWDAATGGELMRLSGAAGAVYCVAFSPDGSRVAGGSWDHIVHVWDARCGTKLHSLRGGDARICSVAFSPDGKLIAGGSKDKTLRLWDAESGELVFTFGGYHHEVNSVAFAPDGKWVAGGSDNMLRIWDLSTRAPLPGFVPWTQIGVEGLAVSPDGQRIAGASYDATVRIWQVATGREVACLHGHREQVYCVAFSPDGRMLVSGSKDNTVRLWDVQTQYGVVLHSGAFELSCGVCVSRCGRKFAAGARDGSLRVWEAATGAELLRIAAVASQVNAVCFSPDGRSIATASTEGTISVWDLATGAEKLWLRGDSSPVRSITFSCNGKRLAATSRDRVRIWDVRPGMLGKLSRLRKPIQTAPLEGGAHSMAFSPDGRHIATGSGRGDVELWEVRTGRRLAHVNLGDHLISCMTYTPDGKRLLSGGHSVSRLDEGRREYTVWSCDAKTAALVEEFIVLGEIRELAQRHNNLPFQAVSHVLETAFRPAGGQTAPVAWHSERLSETVAHPDGRIWSGRAGGQFLAHLQLHGDAGPEPAG